MPKLFLIFLLFLFSSCKAFPKKNDAVQPFVTEEELKLIRNQIRNNQTENDIKFSEKQKKLMRQRAGVVGVDHWPDGVLVHSFQNSNYEQKRMIQLAFNEYRKYTCINFRQKSYHDRNYVAFTTKQGCWSSIGMDGGPQELSLGRGCYYEPVTAMHEIAHALGVMHEQTRPDRDMWIKVMEQNIQADMKHNFERYPQGLVTHLPYDYKSIMHYDKMAFSKNRSPTMVTTYSEFQDVIGQNVGFSVCDIAKINSLYKCDKTRYLTTCSLSRNVLVPFEETL